MQKLMVISHERSGTHFLINTLANLVGASTNQEDLHLTESEDNYESGAYKEDVQVHLKSLAQNEGPIIKSHHHHIFFEDFDFNEHNIVPFYIYRDPRDVMVSCHHYFNSHPHLLTSRTFPSSSGPLDLAFRVQPTEYAFDKAYSYYKNTSMLERWCRHVNPYLKDERFHKIKYEDLNLNFEETCEKLSIFLQKTSQPLHRPSLQHTSVSPRKGIVGDWKNHFSELMSDEILDYIKHKGMEIECQ
jgi:hypothetical protein